MSLTKIFAVLAVVLLQANSAFAIGGTPLPQSEIPQSLCSIEFKDDGGKGRCSGVLISPNQVMTAGHCLLSTSSDLYVPLSRFHVTCGNQKARVVDSVKDDQNSQIIKRLMSENDSLALQNEAATKDIAVLILKKSIDGPFMKKLTANETHEKFFDRGALRVDVECRFAGNAVGPKAATFEIGGKSNYQLKQLPGYEAALIHQPESFPTDQARFAIEGTVEAAGAYVQEGDSGGPAYCKLKSESEWYLIGVLSMGKYGFAGDSSYSIIKVATVWSSVVRYLTEETR